MADVTVGVPPTGASEFNPPADFKEVYDHFGDPTMYSVATVAALPSSGNWDGRLLQAAATGLLYRWNGAWKLVAGGDIATPYRSNTPVVGVKDVRIFTGLASGTTNAGGVLAHTFPAPFPTACVGVQLMPDHQSGFAGGNLPYLVNGTVSRTGFQTLWPSAAGIAVNLAYIAIGY